jgi:ABC-2 type transport system ATP-binding protein
MRRIDLQFDGPVEPSELEGVEGARDVQIDGDRVTLAFDGRMAELLAVLAEGHDVLDISTREADLEEIFLTYYRDESGES